MSQAQPAVESSARRHVKPSKPKRKIGRPRLPPLPNDDCDAYTIPTFCRRHTISPAQYYKLRRNGLGPKEMRLGGRVAISKEAAAEWRREREAGAEARTD